MPGKAAPIVLVVKLEDHAEEVRSMVMQLTRKKLRNVPAVAVNILQFSLGGFDGLSFLCAPFDIEEDNKTSEATTKAQPTGT